MFQDSENESTIYMVVVNKEEQYSIWPLEKALPDGWQAAGKEGQKSECLDYIDTVWTDMQPLSLRQRIAAV